jgi:signal transduction histidine kinase
MENERIRVLKSIAEKITASPDSNEQITLLTKGFELFSKETERLDNAYLHLKAEFRTVNQRLHTKVQELHVLTEYLDNILKNMSQGLLFIDLEGNVTTYNREAESILGPAQSQVLFQPFHAHFEDTIFGYSMEKALKESLAPKTSFATLNLQNGQKKILEIDNSFIPSKQEEALHLGFTRGVIILIRDISELRRLQTISARNERMKALGEMAAEVAHEIRNPLGGIKGFASLLVRDLKESPEQLHMAESIVEGSNTLDRLVAHVLNYSRPLNLELETVNLADFLKEVEESLIAENIFGDKIAFKLINPQNMSLPLDPGLMKSVVRNLLINGMQAMPNGGHLTLKCGESEEKAVIEVIDTGIGIPDELLKKIFSPFFSTKAEGNGLGLAEALKVARAHGGDITVESTVGFGTCFTIKLPLKV